MSARYKATPVAARATETREQNAAGGERSQLTTSEHLRQQSKQLADFYDAIVGHARSYRDLSLLISEPIPFRAKKALDRLLSDEADPSIALYLYAIWVCTPWNDEIPAQDYLQLLELMGWLDGNMLRGARARWGRYD